MPAYNTERFIQQSIDSVINQSYKYWELIIIDDGSTDNTLKIIKENAKKDNRISFYEQPNKKQAAARNLGTKHAKGEWIAYLDADDLWAQHKLEIQIEYIHKFDSDIFFTGGIIINAHGEIISTYDTIFGMYSGLDIYKTMFFWNPIPILSVIVKKNWVIKIGCQDEDSKIVGCEDWDYWLRIAKEGANYYGINQTLFSYRINPNGTSRKLLQMKMAECYAMYKNFDIRLFSLNEIIAVKKRFLDLSKFIITNLFILRDKSLISFYLKIVKATSISYKFFLANVLFQFFGLRSKRMVIFILYH